jgi:putative peptidoglycan binding protein
VSLAFANYRRAPQNVRHAACALLAIALGAGLAAAAAAATATTATTGTRTSTTKSTAAHTAAKATGAKPTATGSPTAHKVATATRATQPQVASHPATSQMAKSAATARGTGPKTTRKSGTALAKNRKSPKSTPRERVQAVPTPDRYQEIQQALADRGFYKGEVNGTWGADSVGALKAFQVSQKLTDDGKINALTLIGLGLGAKHTSYAPSAAPSVSGSPPPGQASGGVTGDAVPVAPQIPPGAASSGGTTNPQQPASPAPAPATATPQNGPAAPPQPHVPDGLSPPGISE